MLLSWNHSKTGLVSLDVLTCRSNLYYTVIIGSRITESAAFCNQIIHVRLRFNSNSHLPVITLGKNGSKRLISGVYYIYNISLLYYCKIIYHLIFSCCSRGGHQGIQRRRRSRAWTRCRCRRKKNWIRKKLKTNYYNIRYFLLHSL